MYHQVTGTTPTRVWPVVIVVLNNPCIDPSEHLHGSSLLTSRDMTQEMCSMERNNERDPSSAINCDTKQGKPEFLFVHKGRQGCIATRLGASVDDYKIKREELARSSSA
ncbi:hypothetical protein J6590_056290 [Homalodisca vitripennis]|nr:hypothetical protein J6590_056290 [Homalodisca vitripennis]